MSVRSVTGALSLLAQVAWSEYIRRYRTVVKALCSNYPCHHICSRVCHCPAGQERVRWYALFDKFSRPVPPGVNALTGEIMVSADTIYKLHHMGENHHRVVFSPINTMPASPVPAPVRTSVRVKIDRAVSEAGFPINKGNRYSYSTAMVNRSFVTPLLKALPDKKIVKIIGGIMIAVAVVAVLWCSAVMPASTGTRAQVGHTYNSYGVDITGK